MHPILSLALSNLYVLVVHTNRGTAYSKYGTCEATTVRAATLFLGMENYASQSRLSLANQALRLVFTRVDH